MIDYTSMEDRLNGEYRQVFQKAELYSDMNGIHENVKADKMMNLLDLLMTAEENGKPVAGIIGSDVEKFCQDYFADYDIRAQICLIPEKLYYLALCLGSALLIEMLFPEEPSADLLHRHSDIMPFVGGIFAGGIVGILLRYLIGPFIFRAKKIPVIVYHVLACILVVIADVVVSVICLMKCEVLLPVFPLLVGDVVYMAGYLLVRSVLRYRKTGSIRKTKLLGQEFEFHLLRADDGFSDRLDQKTQEVLVKRFQRINRRRSRRKQSAMSTQEFIQKVRKEDATIPIWVWSLGIIYVILGGNIIVDEISSIGWGFGTVVLIAIVLLLYIPLFLFLRNCFYQGAKARAKILEAWDEYGVVITEKKV